MQSDRRARACAVCLRHPADIGWSGTCVECNRVAVSGIGAVCARPSPSHPPAALTPTAVAAALPATRHFQRHSQRNILRTRHTQAAQAKAIVKGLANRSTCPPYRGVLLSWHPVARAASPSPFSSGACSCATPPVRQRYLIHLPDPPPPHTLAHAAATLAASSTSSVSLRRRIVAISPSRLPLRHTCGLPSPFSRHSGACSPFLPLSLPRTPIAAP